MDKRKGLLNISVSIGFKIVLTILSIVVKRFLIQSCGNEVNGLNSLYLSIIGFLSVAELGVGGAITFSMYRPIVEGDSNKVSALYQIFHRVYLIVGTIILTAGIVITPFVKFFAKDYEQVNVNFYITFVLMLISVVITYFYGAKTALINAYKNNYITTVITSGGAMFQYVLQICVLLGTKSFEWYLGCRILSAIFQGILIELVVRKKYKSVINNKQKVDYETKNELLKNIKAMFMHKVGALLVNTVDSVVISVFVGVVSLGEYSNYSAILASLGNVLSLVFTSIISVLGHMYVESDKETSRKYCEALHLVNFVLGTMFYLGYYSVIDFLISILFSSDLVITRSISFVIALNGFVQFMRRSVLAFRDATGTFYNDRWKPLIEGGVNIVLSVILVKLIGVPGVLVATVFTNLLICHVIDPYVLYKYAFSTHPQKYYLCNYGFIALFFVSLTVLHFCLPDVDDAWKGLLLNGLVSILISLITCTIAVLINRKKINILFLNRANKVS